MRPFQWQCDSKNKITKTYKNKMGNSQSTQIIQSIKKKETEFSDIKSQIPIFLVPSIYTNTNEYTQLTQINSNSQIKLNQINN